MLYLRGDEVPAFFAMLRNCVFCTFPYLNTVEVDAGHSGLSCERDEGCIMLGQVAASYAVLLLCEHYDGASFRRFIRQRSKLRRVRQVLLTHAWSRNEGGSCSISKRDGPGFVEQQHIDVTRSLDCTSRHRNHISLN